MAAATAEAETPPHEPVAVIVLGMAGSGKTTLMQRLVSHMNAATTPCYTINLDPAVIDLPYGRNIDIRDTVNYKQVMQQFSLGPNGGILTSLNLFATRFDQVISFVEKRSSSLECILVDTPGQIEVFTWSASGAIITEALATAVPVVVLFVIDTPRTCNPSTFMSNMLCACSILYKTRLPFIIALNKTDVQDPTHVMEWLQSFDAFQAAFESDESYSSTLARSLGLVLDEIYATIPVVPVSALTGDGIEALLQKVQAGKADFVTDYRADMMSRKREMEKKAAKKMAKAAEATEQLRKSGGGDRKRGVSHPGVVKGERDMVDVEDEGGTALFVGQHEEGEDELTEERGGREDDGEGDSSDSDQEGDEDPEEAEKKQHADMLKLHRQLADISGAHQQPSMSARNERADVRIAESAGAAANLDQLRRDLANSRVDGSMDVLD